MRSIEVAMGNLLMSRLSLMITSAWSRSRRSGMPTKTDYETRVSQYFKDYANNRKAVHLYIVLHLVKSLHVLIALCRLPSLCIAPPASLEGTVIHDSLLQHSVCWRITGLATAVIFVPDEVGEYSLGASKQTLRRKVRHAKRLGIYWTEVNDPCERQLLLEYANELERAHPDAVYRNPSPSNNDLLTYKLWLVAYAADGRPLLLSVTPVDGETGLIRYFRTLGVGEEQSNARYLMTKVLVERLSSLG